MRVENLDSLAFTVTDFRQLGAPREHYDDRLGLNLIEVSTTVVISGVAHHVRMRQERGRVIAIDGACLAAMCAAHYWRPAPRRFVHFVDGLIEVEARATDHWLAYVERSGEAFAQTPDPAHRPVDACRYFFNRARDARAAAWRGAPELVAAGLDRARIAATEVPTWL